MLKNFIFSGFFNDNVVKMQQKTEKSKKKKERIPSCRLNSIVYAESNEGEVYILRNPKSVKGSYDSIIHVRFGKDAFRRDYFNFRDENLLSGKWYRETVYSLAEMHAKRMAKEFKVARFSAENDSGDQFLISYLENLKFAFQFPFRITIFEKDGIIGYACCSPFDNYNRGVGSKIAMHRLNRALKALESGSTGREYEIRGTVQERNDRKPDMIKIFDEKPASEEIEKKRKERKSRKNK